MSAGSTEKPEAGPRGVWVERDRATGKVLLRTPGGTVKLSPTAARALALRLAAASNEDAEGLVEGVQALSRLAADGKRFYDGFRAIFGEDDPR